MRHDYFAIQVVIINLIRGCNMSKVEHWVPRKEFCQQMSDARTKFDASSCIIKYSISHDSSQCVHPKFHDRYCSRIDERINQPFRSLLLQIDEELAIDRQTPADLSKLLDELGNLQHSL
jgi:hypothetical protein